LRRLGADDRLVEADRRLDTRGKLCTGLGVVGIKRLLDETQAQVIDSFQGGDIGAGESAVGVDGEIGACDLGGDGPHQVQVGRRSHLEFHPAIPGGSRVDGGRKHLVGGSEGNHRTDGNPGVPPTEALPHLEAGDVPGQIEIRTLHGESSRWRRDTVENRVEPVIVRHGEAENLIGRLGKGAAGGSVGVGAVAGDGPALAPSFGTAGAQAHKREPSLSYLCGGRPEGIMQGDHDLPDLHRVDQRHGPMVRSPEPLARWRRTPERRGRRRGRHTPADGRRRFR